MRLLVALTVTVALASCSSGTPVAPGGTALSTTSSSSSSSGTGGTAATLCTPGASSACACPGGVSGVQVCDDNGFGFGDCQCPDAGAGGASSSSSSSSSSSGAGGSGGASASSSSSSSSGAPCMPDDGNECTDDACVNGQPVHTPKALGTPCAQGLCDSTPACVANIPIKCKIDGGNTVESCGIVGMSPWNIYYPGGTCYPTAICKDAGNQAIPCFCPPGAPCKVWEGQYLFGTCQ